MENKIEEKIVGEKKEDVENYQGSSIQAPAADDKREKMEDLSLAKRIPGLGIGLCLVSTLVITLNFVLVKRMTSLNPLQFMFYRSVFMTLAVLPGLSKSKFKSKSKSKSVFLSVCTDNRKKIGLKNK